MSDAEMQRDGTLMIGGGGKSEINGKPVENSTYLSLSKVFSAIKIVSFSCKKSLNCCFPLIFPLNLLVTY